MTAGSAKATFLADRGIVKVAGEDARTFLNGLVTADVGAVAPGAARFGALLTPQGKITVDFLITEATAAQGGGYLLDCPRSLAAWLADRLNFYKLRAKVRVEDLSAHLGVLAAWNVSDPVLVDLAFPDPRDARLGWRALVPEELKEKAATLLGATLAGNEAYEANRIACGVPKGGVDFIYSDAFPHDAMMDRLHGVDFGKGCYVGQEVVSRMEHRGTARNRVVRVRLDGPAPAPGEPIMVGEQTVGVMGSAHAGEGLALVRVDRVADAAAAGGAFVAGGLALRLESPEIDMAASKRTG